MWRVVCVRVSGKHPTVLGCRGSPLYFCYFVFSLVFSSLPPFPDRSMRPFGSRRRGPPAGRARLRSSSSDGPRAVSGVQAGRSPFQLASRCLRGVVLLLLPTVTASERARSRGRVGGFEVRASPRRPPASFPLSLCSTAGAGEVAQGLGTEPGCVTAAWPREPSGVLNHARCCRCWPRSVCPRVPAASSARAVGRPSRERTGKKGVEKGRPRAAKGGVPLRRGRRPRRLLSVPPRRLLPSEPPRRRGLGRRVAPASTGRCLL